MNNYQKRLPDQRPCVPTWCRHIGGAACTTVQTLTGLYRCTACGLFGAKTQIEASKKDADFVGPL